MIGIIKDFKDLHRSPQVKTVFGDLSTFFVMCSQWLTENVDP